MKFAYASGSRPLEGYTIKRGVGVGGFGEVYFATSDAGKEVALKRIQRNLDVELRGVGQCLNLKHVNLIDLFDIKYDDHGEGWVVMEYVNGESLKDVLDRNPNGLPPDEIKHWFGGITAGVAYLHSQGIVHRDLKPGNIFADDDVVKIGDYGLSKFISSSRGSGQTESVGTFHYMAPEIGKGSYGKGIDVYALGVILYELLTGRVPFEGESSQEIMMKHLTADPDLSGIAQPHRSVIERALAKDPQYRFAGVPEMLAALSEKQTSTAEKPRNVVPAPALLSGNHTPSPSSDTLYIGDEQPEEILFGEVNAVVTAEAVGPPHTQTNAEPIAKAVGNGWTELVGWWNNAQLGTPLKVLLLVGTIFLMMMVTLNAYWLIPVAVLVAVSYVVYYGVRELALALRGPSTPKAHSNTVPRRARSRGEALRAALVQKSAGERLADLIGSMLMSALVSSVLCLMMMILAGQSLDGSVHTWTFYTWLTLTCTAGAWTVLGAGKYWEAEQGDAIRRRFFLLAMGLALGAAVFAGSETLMIPWSSGSLASAPLFSAEYSSTILNGNVPRISAYFIFFAVLLAVMRWWKQADPLRKTRLSLWRTIVGGLWGWILPLPQPWGLMIAITISVAVQLSAPWFSPEQRREIGRRYLET